MLQTDFIGRLHPLLVHLPIGILLFAFVLLLLQKFKKTDFSGTIDVALLLGGLSAAAACGAGWLLAQSGEYDADMVFKHQWTGIGTAVLSLAAYFFKPWRGVLTTLMAGFLTVAGHYGGSLTHGEDYLFPKKNTTSVNEVNLSDSLQAETSVLPQHIDSQNIATKIAAAQPTEIRSFLYRDKVIPILEKKCYGCHSATKKKGGLRLDSEEFIKAGGENGPVLMSGKPEKSRMFSNCLLPEEDDLHMPPKGKPQLTSKEIAVLHFWIKRGAPFGEIVEKVEVNNAIQTTVNAAASLTIPPLPGNLAVKTAKPTAHTVSTEETILSQNIAEVPPPVFTDMKQKNVILSPFGEGTNYVMANFVNVKNYSTVALDALKIVENQLIRLKLSGQPVSDNDLQKLSIFKNLTRLHLDNTNITDAGLIHLKNLPNLEQLNLYGTNITDAGLEALAKCPNLKVVFVWQTKITKRGVSTLKKALPNVQVELGGTQFPKQDTSKTK
jgi:uncharacterized membrane protein